MSRTFWLLLGRVALAFAVLFSTIAAGQYWFLRNQLRQKATRELSSLADGMKEDIAFADSWNLEGYRRTTSGPDIYLVETNDGTLIDTHGYLPGMVSRVALPFRFEYSRPFQFVSEVGEAWNLYVRPLRDGLVILGARAAITPADVAQRFVVNASRFGGSVADAISTPERAIDEAFDYAVIDADGTLRFANGGIPLKAAAPTIPDHPALSPLRQIDGALYLSFVEPVISRFGRKVAVITVFEDVTDEHRLLHQSAIFNGTIAVVLWIITTAVAATYLRRIRVAEISCAQIPFLEESDTVEFKSSLRWDYKQQKLNPVLEKQVVKAIVGFLNSETGGNLVIGMDDQKELLGLEPDYSTLSTRLNRDGFEQKLQQVLFAAIGERCCARWLKISFCSLQGKDLCIVKISPASEAIYPREKDSQDTLYVRIGNTTRPLSAREAVAFAADRWSVTTLHRLNRRAGAALSAA